MATTQDLPRLKEFCPGCRPSSRNPVDECIGLLASLDVYGIVYLLIATPSVNVAMVGSRSQTAWIATYLSLLGEFLWLQADTMKVIFPAIDSRRCSQSWM
jgi:hypothetical protein